MTTSRIHCAYCQELDEIVSIDTARKYFLCEEPPLDAYHFFCGDLNCAGAPEPVRITGVAYRVPASEGTKHVTAHYRLLDKHHPLCHWQTPEDLDLLRPGETENEAKQRRLRRKLCDFVTVFDPAAPDDEVGRPRVQRPAAPDIDIDGLGRRPRNRAGGADNLQAGYNRTNQLSRLVETYSEAKATLTKIEFNELEIRVINEGVLALNEYFCHLSRASPETRNRVIFGGATLIGRYGQGFKFKFYDKVNKAAAVHLYVSPEMMADYRFRNYLELSLARAKNVKYFTIYALGSLVQGKSVGSFDLIVDDLRHLTLVLGPQISLSVEE